jgi:diketogulonate reductase-like aldo/keto reductase
MPQIPLLPLNNGVRIPQLGLGTWRMRDEAECQQAVRWALELGYRHIDTAQIYGNEQFIGGAIKESGVARKDLFITTKIWNDNQGEGDLEPSLGESLEKLQTNYVDLLLLHWPLPGRGPAWRKMEQVAEAGKTKAIGVSNYTIRHLKELLSECSIKPAVNQVELHVFLQQPELVRFCQDNGIVVEAYSPLAHGESMNDPILGKLARRHGKTPAQLMLRWCVQKGLVVIPKSTHKQRLQENSAIFDFELTDKDLSELAKLERGFRTSGDPTHMP